MKNYRIVEKLDGKFYLETRDIHCVSEWVPYTDRDGNEMFEYTLEDAKELLASRRVEEGENPFRNIYEIE